MRYNGGIFGGLDDDVPVRPGNGVFGARIVDNFGSWIGPQLCQTILRPLRRRRAAASAFSREFERWWGGFFRLNEGRITLDRRALFVSSRTVHQHRQLPGRPLDIKSVRAPIIVFCRQPATTSRHRLGAELDPDTYADVDGSASAASAIVWSCCTRESARLGIFVSASVAKHARVARS